VLTFQIHSQSETGKDRPIYLEVTILEKTFKSFHEFREVYSEDSLVQNILFGKLGNGSGYGMSDSFGNFPYLIVFTISSQIEYLVVYTFFWSIKRHDKCSAQISYVYKRSPWISITLDQDSIIFIKFS
jgi:hypothetical protein